MNQYVMPFDNNSNLRELSLEEIETVNGGTDPVTGITLVTVAVVAFWGSAFSAGYNAGFAAGQALWG